MSAPPDLRDPDAVCAALARGAAANLGAACRRGSIDVIAGPARLIATGDLHDNPVHLERVVALAQLAAPDPRHLTLHEVIHADVSGGGVDLSYRALVRIAALKGDHPEVVHTLLANHELAQIVGAGILKDGVNVVAAFNAGVEHVFAGAAPRVIAAIGAFVRSMPLALRCQGAAGAGDLVCAHSLPAPDLMDRFDPRILERDLREDDYTPRRGSAHLMVWGRDHTPEQLASLAQAWGAAAFILGHEKAEAGWFVRAPNCLVLNSDHALGAYTDVDLGGPITLERVAVGVRPLAGA